ncbi:MAG: SDR family NAD(P)-dependent oxidoreductase [Clostridia bacterium]|nr:SDR family NAD(P)-dependent oxidoreductase [Clostridia bacterium]
MKRSILITGAFGGMGKEAAKVLSGNGFRVFALDKTVGAEEENIIPIQADITDETA